MDRNSTWPFPLPLPAKILTASFLSPPPTFFGNCLGCFPVDKDQLCLCTILSLGSAVISRLVHAGRLRAWTVTRLYVLKQAEVPPSRPPALSLMTKRSFEPPPGLCVLRISFSHTHTHTLSSLSIFLIETGSSFLLSIPLPLPIPMRFTSSMHKSMRKRRKGAPGDPWHSSSSLNGHLRSYRGILAPIAKLTPSPLPHKGSPRPPPRSPTHS